MRKNVLITGCSYGSAGNQMAKEYHSRGLHVFATARRLAAMSDLDIPGITLLQLDVTNLESIRDARDKVKSILEDNTGLDLLVNNAGVAGTSPALDQQLSDTRMIFETNVFGMMAMVQEFMSLLMLSTDACIVNIGSVAGVMPYAFGSSYNASKAAVHAYSDTLRVELRPLNIQVITVILGGVKTNIFTYPPKPLPEDSYYASIEEIFRKRRSGQVKRATPTDRFAYQFANATLRSSVPNRLQIAIGSTLVTWIVWLIPTSIIDFVMSYYLGLHKLAATRKEEAKRK